jgi:hypothetical protein
MEDYQLEALTNRWKESVYDNVDEVDPGYEELWSSLALGFALGAGHTVEDAKKFVSHVSCRGLI